MARILNSFFPGTCSKCGKAFPKGAQIYYDKSAGRGQKSWHVNCEGVRTAAPAAPAQQTLPRFTSNFEYFESITSFVDACARGGRGFEPYPSLAGESLEKSISDARTGNERLVPAAQSLIDQLRVTIPDAIRAAYIPQPFGAYPIVPEFLAGYPLCMRAKRRINDDRAPVRVYVDLTTSARLSEKHIARRGTAALALAMMVSEARALDLFVLSPLNLNGGAAAAVVRINAQPLELATACNALTSAGFSRNLGYGYCHVLGHRTTSVNWAFGTHPTGDGLVRYAQAMRAALDLGPADLFIPPAYVGDSVLTDPAGWLTERLANLGAIDVEALAA